MGRYIDRTHLEARFGAANVAAWSNLDNDQAVGDVDRVESAVAWAEAVIDDRFRGGGYRLPLSGAVGTPPVVVDWAARLAGAHLCSSRAGEGAAWAQDVQRQVHAEIDEYLAGRRRIDAGGIGGPRGAVVVP